ncbi:hypothetical protein Aau02nite_28500 [Amorphoplanes auranticolor]|uniref:DUF3558 domain-containing protein n=1 Tax=Actinoplanes auranticolor TaxID=47988 RepID=A0A919VLH4_9ACTN|nr:hypothetical protein Aau02nite_28500 [Actinoplanes auranticolor]
MGSVVAAVLLGAVAACAGQTGGGAEPSGKLRIEPAWSSCADAGAESSGPASGGGDLAGLPSLDDSFQPVAVVVCTLPTLRPPSGGAKVAATESRADDVTALVAALRLPDEPMSGDACSLELYLPPFFALLDEQGRWVRPGLPHDGCGKVRSEVREALGGLRLTPVSPGPAPETGSSQAAAAGCTRQWADMVWVTAQWGTSGEPAVVPEGFDGPVRVRLCAYRVPADQQRSGKPAGEFASGRELSDEQWTAARKEVEAAAPAPACSDPASEFVVLHLGSGQIYVERDGCRRLLAQTADGLDTIRQASPELLAQLAG